MTDQATAVASPPPPPPSSTTNTTTTPVGDTTKQTSSTSSKKVTEGRPRNRIQVSREKRPLSFFLSLAKKFLLNEDEVELSGLGLAVTTVVTVAEILKNSGHVVITKISTSLVDMKDEPEHQRPRSSNGLPKAKIQIWIQKSDQFQELMTEEDANRGGYRRSNSRGKQNNNVEDTKEEVAATAKE